MKVSIDTKEDSHDEIKKVIKMLQNLVGDSQEIFTNQPVSESNPQEVGSTFTNIFGDASALPQQSAASEVNQETTPETAKEAETEETPQSTEDLFAELFSEEELKKMNEAEVKDEDEKEEVKTKGNKYNIELY